MERRGSRGNGENARPARKNTRNRAVLADRPGRVGTARACSKPKLVCRVADLCLLGCHSCRSGGGARLNPTGARMTKADIVIVGAGSGRLRSRGAADGGPRPPRPPAGSGRRTRRPPTSPIPAALASSARLRNRLGFCDRAAALHGGTHASLAAGPRGGRVQRDQCHGARARPSGRLRPVGRGRRDGVGLGRSAALLHSPRKPRPSRPKTAMGERGPVRLCQPARPHPLSEAHCAAGIEYGLRPIRDHNGQELAGADPQHAHHRGRPAPERRRRLPDRSRSRQGEPRGAHGPARRPAGLRRRRPRATGVHALEGGTSQRLDAHHAVVLSAGAIGTPAILMRSGLGPGAALAALGITVRRDLPGVGQNLQDHLLAAGNVYRARRPLPPTSTQHSESLTYIHARAQSARGRAGPRGGVHHPSRGFGVAGARHLCAGPRRGIHLDVRHHAPAKPRSSDHRLGGPAGKAGHRSRLPQRAGGSLAVSRSTRLGAEAGSRGRLRTVAGRRAVTAPPATSRAGRRDWRSSRTPSSPTTIRSEPAGWERTLAPSSVPTFRSRACRASTSLTLRSYRASRRARSTRPSSRSLNGPAICFPRPDDASGFTNRPGTVP